MRNAVLISAGLHVAAIALTVAGLPSLFDSKRIEVVPISVELVTFTEEEKTAPDPKPKPEPRLDPPPPPPATAEPPPPEPVAEPVPEPSPPEPAPKPVIEAKPKPKPMLKLLARKVMVPQPRTKPAPPPDAFQKLLKNLNQERKHEDDERKRAQEKAITLVPPSPPVQPAPRTPSPTEQRMLAATLLKQVSRCWRIPFGVKDAHTIRVGVRIFLKPDGHLNGPPQVEDGKRMRSDLAFRAVAESALRALRHPRCIPLRLPLKSFETWREISFNFDPRELLR